nr:hypothetical protein [Chryseobacterium sp. Tr-659]
MNNPASLVDPDGRMMYDWKAHDEGREGVYKNDSGGVMSWDDAMNTLYDAAGSGRSYLNNSLSFYTSGSFGILQNYFGDGGSGGSPTFQFPKGQEAYYKENYPVFYDFVKNVLPKMVGDTNFMKALSSASGFSIEELSKIFQYGQGMELKVMDLTLGDAEYLHNGITESNTLNTAAIDTPLAQWFEKADRSTSTIAGLTNLLYMSSVVAHETAHWGDDVKRKVRV